jgi:hypothetical protein
VTDRPAPLSERELLDRAIATVRALRERIKAIEPADLPDVYSEHPDLIWRQDVLALFPKEESDE